MPRARTHTRTQRSGAVDPPVAPQRPESSVYTAWVWIYHSSPRTKGVRCFSFSAERGRGRRETSESPRRVPLEDAALSRLTFLDIMEWAYTPKSCGQLSYESPRVLTNSPENATQCVARTPMRKGFLVASVRDAEIVGKRSFCGY